MPDLQLHTHHRRSLSPDPPIHHSVNMHWTRPGYNPNSPTGPKYPSRRNEQSARPNASADREPALLLRMDMGASYPTSSGPMDHGHQRTTIRSLSERIVPGTTDGAATGLVALGSHRVEPLADHEAAMRRGLSRHDVMISESSSRGNKSYLEERNMDSLPPVNPSHTHPSRKLQPLRSSTPSRAAPIDPRRQNGSHASQSSTPPTNDFDLAPKDDNFSRSRLSLKDRIGSFVVQNANLRASSNQRGSENSEESPLVDHRSVEAVLTPDVCSSILSSAIAAGKQYAEMKSNRFHSGESSSLSVGQNTDDSAAGAPNTLHSDALPSATSYGHPSSDIAPDVHRTSERPVPIVDTSIPPADSAFTVSPFSPAPSSTGLSEPIPIPINPAFFPNVVRSTSSASTSQPSTRVSPSHRYSDDSRLARSRAPSPYRQSYSRRRSRSPSSSSSRYYDVEGRGWRRSQRPRESPSYHPEFPPVLPMSHTHSQYSPHAYRRSRSPASRRPRSPSRHSETRHSSSEYYHRSSSRQPLRPPATTSIPPLSPHDHFPHPHSEKERSRSYHSPHSPVHGSPTSEKYYGDARSPVGHHSRHEQEKFRREYDREREPLGPADHRSVAEPTNDTLVKPSPKPSPVAAVARPLPLTERDEHPDTVDMRSIADSAQSHIGGIELISTASSDNIPGLWITLQGLPMPDILEYSFQVSSNVALSWCLPLLVDIEGLETKIKRQRPPIVSLKLQCLPTGLVNTALETMAKSPVDNDVGLALSKIPSRWPPPGQLIIEVNPGQRIGKTFFPKDLDSIVPFVELNMVVHEGSNLIRFIQLGNLSGFLFILYATPSSQPLKSDKETPEHGTLAQGLSLDSLQELLSNPRANTGPKLLSLKNVIVQSMAIRQDS